MLSGRRWNRAAALRARRHQSLALDPKGCIMEERIKIGISSCLLGNPVRFDGGHKLDRFLVGTLGQSRNFLGRPD